MPKIEESEVLCSDSTALIYKPFTVWLSVGSCNFIENNYFFVICHGTNYNHSPVYTKEYLIISDNIFRQIILYKKMRKIFNFHAHNKTACQKDSLFPDPAIMLTTFTPSAMFVVLKSND